VETIRDRIQDESWEGIQPVEDLPGRGRGVKALRAFSKGEVVCHYNGVLLNNKEGKYINSYNFLSITLTF